MAFAISAGAKIRTIATTIEEGFSLPKVEKFEELINERTKAILICNPNNPTGYLYTRREMNQIRDLVKKYDFSSSLMKFTVNLSIPVLLTFLPVISKALKTMWCSSTRYRNVTLNGYPYRCLDHEK